MQAQLYRQRFSELTNRISECMATMATKDESVGFSGFYRGEKKDQEM